MCRFVAYMGHPIILDEILFKPKNSLIKQSIHAKEAEEPLNGDGFGLGWYVPEIAPTPALFTSIQPAWNDRNLMYLAPKIQSGCFFAHVRAASAGGVSFFNCHPFHYDRYLFMHNGGVGDFQKIKRYLRRELSDEVYDWVQGQTDSEHVFALFLNRLLKHYPEPALNDLVSCLKETVKEIERIQRLHQVPVSNYFNFALTDGKRMVAVRYVSEPQAVASSLHYSKAAEHTYDEGVCHMKGNGDETGAVLIASEKLTSHRADWQDIPVNHVVTVDENLTIELNEFL